MFMPVTNTHGVAYAGFTFQVRDDGGITNGGVDLDPSANTLTINVAAVADAPILTAASVTGVEGQSILLDIDIALSDIDGSESLGTVAIGNVPASASLTAGINQGGGELEAQSL